MSNLSPVEFEQLKLLLSGKTLSTGEQTITLDILRFRFSNFFSNLGLTEANLKDDKFLIKYLTESHNRNKIKEALKKELSLSPNQQIELIEALEIKPVVIEEIGEEVSGQGVSEQQAPPADTATGASAGGMPGMPSFPSVSPARRRIYRVYRAPEPPKPEIHIANASGYVTEPGDASKLVKASESGAIKETGDSSKLVTTSGGVVKEAPPSKILVADKGGLREHAIKPSRFRFPSALTNFGKNIGSKMGVFIKRNLTPMRLGTLVSGGIGAVAGSAFGPMGTLTGGIGGGLMPSWLRSGGGGKFFGKVGNGLVNATARLANPAAKMSIPPVANKYVLLFLGGFLLLVVGLALIAPSSTPPDASLPPGGGATTPVPLGYKIPLRNTSVAVAADRVQIVKDLVKLSWKKSKVDEYWDHIVQRSTNEGWNPAFVLALWIEETGASERTVERMGGGNVPNAKGEFALGHLGCAPTQEQTIDESLNCLNNFLNLHFPNNSYTDDQFSKFMLIYSEGPGGVNFTKNPNFPFNFKIWYLTLIPVGSPGAPEPVTPPVGALASCPVPEGRIKTPSYQASPTTGHCSPSYGSCPSGSRRAKSIDVDTKGGNVFFPKIDGQEVDWYYLNQFPLDKPTDCESGRSDCGIGVVFQAKTGSTFWTLHLLHLDPKTTLPFNTADANRSGAVAGKTVSNVYVHINIGKDIKNAFNPPKGDKDLDPGWLPADFMCP